MSTHANMVKMTTATTGTGTITLGSASSGYQSFADAYGANATVDVLIADGTAWEVARNCTYTHSGTTLTRGTLEDSSTGSALNLTGSAVVSVVATAEFGNSSEATMQSHISGLAINYASTSSITATVGAAYIESLGYVVSVPSALTASGLSGLTASTLHHVYLYLSSGTPTLEVSTTAPNATPFAGNARSKNGDTSRRYLGSFRTNSGGSNNVANFTTSASAAGQLSFYWLDNDVSFGRVVSGAAKTTAATSVSIASLCPANVTNEVLIACTVDNSSGSGGVEIIIGLANSNSYRVAAFGFAAVAPAQYPAQTGWVPVLQATPNFYWYNTSGTISTSSTYIDVLGYKVAR